jgi:hypothetical protein
MSFLDVIEKCKHIRFALGVDPVGSGAIRGHDDGAQPPQGGFYEFCQKEFSVEGGSMAGEMERQDQGGWLNSRMVLGQSDGVAAVSRLEYLLTNLH